MWFFIRIFTIASGWFINYLDPEAQWWIGIAMATFFIILGLISLIRWGDMLVSWSSTVARKFGIPPIVVWLTILAFGTSAPELFVNLIASAKWETDLLLSNVIWSNISNILLIWGIAASIALLPVQKSTYKKEIPISLWACFVLLFLMNDQWFDSWSTSILTTRDGIILLSIFVYFLYHVFKLVTHHENNAYEAETGEVHSMKMSKARIFIGLGIYGLYVWGELIVEYASMLAEMFGVSKVMIWASIVAIGTSVPELVTSVIAARKQQTDMAIGNIIWSNIFNIVWIVWLCSVIRPVPVDTSLNTDLIILMIITVWLRTVIMCDKNRSLHRYHGYIFVLLYVCYIWFLLRRG